MMASQFACQYIVVDRRHRVLCQFPTVPVTVGIHSCAKPFQLLPVLTLGLDRLYALTEEELAVMASSALAQSDQVAVILGLLEKTGIREADLQLASAAPAGVIAYRNWLKSGEPKRKRYHPCVGNHIAMFLAQRFLTGNGSGYLDPDSAVQKVILTMVRQLCEERDIVVSRDGCGAPCYEMPLKSLAIGYANLCLYAQTPVFPKYASGVREMRHAFYHCASFLEGEGCLSSILSSHEGVLGKTGINGLVGIAVDNGGYGMAVYSPERSWSQVSRTICHLLRALPCACDDLVDQMERNPYMRERL